MITATQPAMTLMASCSMGTSLFGAATVSIPGIKMPDPSVDQFLSIRSGDEMRGFAGHSKPPSSSGQSRTKPVMGIAALIVALWGCKPSLAGVETIPRPESREMVREERSEEKYIQKKFSELSSFWNLPPGTKIKRTSYVEIEVMLGGDWETSRFGSPLRVPKGSLLKLNTDYHRYHHVVVEFSEQGSFMGIDLAKGYIVKIESDKESVPRVISLEKGDLILTENGTPCGKGWIRFYPDRVLEGCHLAKKIRIRGIPIKKAWAQFHTNGNLSHGILAEDSSILTKKGIRIPCKGEKKIAFHPDKTLKECILAKDFSSELHTGKARHTITLDETGTILRIAPLAEIDDDSGY